MKITVLFHLALSLVASGIVASPQTRITAEFPLVLDSPEHPPHHIKFSGVDPDQGLIILHNVGATPTKIEKVLTHVKPAIWRGGCVPTTSYMYWKALHDSGFDRIFGSLPNMKLAPVQREANLIASVEHYRDYFNPNDSSGPLQADRSGWNSLHDDGRRYFYTALYARYPNSIADLMGSSMAIYGLTQGATSPWNHISETAVWIRNNIPTYDVVGFVYNFESPDFKWPHYELAEGSYSRSAGDHFYGVGVLQIRDSNVLFDMWTQYVKAIDEGRPVFVATNSKAGGGLDHASLGVGYRQNADGMRYWAAYNTWTTTLQWYEFRRVEINTGPAFAIGGLFDLIVTKKEGSTVDHFKPSTVHRFFNPATKAYFFTASPGEAATVYDHNPAWIYQGQSMQVEMANIPGTTPVYRFYNTVSQSHFYTASVQERDGVIQNLPHVYHYEGIAFFVRTQPDPSKKDQPVHRFYIPATASHFFTAFEAEAEHLKRYANPKHMQYEGVAWYAPLGEIYHSSYHYHLTAPGDLASGERWIWAPYLAAGAIDYE